MKKILYALNGTGSGHITRARELIPYLKKEYEVDILISGCNYIINTKLDIKYRFKGFTFVINNNGKVSYLKSFFYNNIIRFVIDLFRFNIKKYDLVISDFEPVSAWSSKLRGVKCIQLSHQASFLSNKTPRPEKKDKLAEFFMNWYSPCEEYIGFHFKEYGKNILGPLLRSKIINAEPKVDDYYVVYLWNYNINYILEVVSKLDKYHFKIFDFNTKEKQNINNCEILPTGDDTFFNAILNCKGVICGAGFELPAEVLYLKKRLYVIPIGNQYEQACNAEALIRIGIDSYEKLDYNHLKSWLGNDSNSAQDLDISNPKHIIKSINEFMRK
tara:strand:- start:166 stop:1152 length:987 start_codon:yes stop_codon:yes gene_type:complete